MRIVLSGGGTAGHINPALALAEVLQERGHEVYFAGTPNGVEKPLVEMAGIPFKGFEVSGFDRSHPLTLAKGLRKLSHSANEAGRWFAELKPHAVVVFGGYACLPAGRAAKAFRVPLIIHEQNSVMGMANDYLSKNAAAVALTYESAGRSVKDQTKIIVTGNPVRKSVLEATRQEGRKYLGIPEDATMLLVFGGSLGARHINTAVSRMKNDLLALDNVYVVHITGPKEFETVQESLALTEEEQKRYIVKDYEDNMGAVLAATDLVVSRAGASSLAEISARCIPAILIPFPYATADHQTANAKEYVERGAALLIADDKVETQEFSNSILGLLKDKQLREDMSKAAQSFETVDASARLADVVELMIKSKWPDLFEEFKEEQEEKATSSSSDVDADAEADSDAEADTDAGADSDAEADTDAGADGDAETGTDAEASRRG